MNKLFACSVNWFDNNSELSGGMEKIVLAADSYATAAEQLVEHYADTLVGYSICEIENPCLIDDLIDE